MNILVKAAVAALFVITSVGAASATTVTFDNLPDYDTVLMDGGSGSPYVENGVTVTSTTPGGVLASYFTAGAVHLDDAGTDMTSGVLFQTGSVFDALGFSFTSLGFDFYDEAPTVIGNIIIRGFLNGAQVVRDRITMSPVFGTVQDIVLGAGFLGLDAFSIEITYPNTGAYCGAPCGHIDLDSVTFGGIAPAPVPLPASGLLLGAAALGLAGLRRSKRA
jgi:hypothetical protein